MEGDEHHVAPPHAPLLEDKPLDGLRTRRLCCGLVWARDGFMVIVVSVLLLLGAGLLCFVWAHDTDVAGAVSVSRRGVAVMGAACVLAVAAVVAAFMTTLTDPGIFPRVRGPAFAGNGGRLVLVNGVHVLTQHCHTCGFHRPVRASHCHRCDHCVDRFDHHCKVLGACIGRRNFPYFYTFVCCASTLCLLGLAGSVTWLVLHVMHQATYLRVLAGVLTLGSAAGALQPTMLVVYYARLIAGGYTQREYVRRGLLYSLPEAAPGVRVPQPFDRGCLGNCSTLLCQCCPPAELEFDESERGSMV